VLELSPESGGPVETIVSFGPSPESEAGEEDDRRPGSRHPCMIPG